MCYRCPHGALQRTNVAPRSNKPFMSTRVSPLSVFRLWNRFPAGPRPLCREFSAQELTSRFSKSDLAHTKQRARLMLHISIPQQGGVLPAGWTRVGEIPLRLAQMRLKVRPVGFKLRHPTGLPVIVTRPRLAEAGRCPVGPSRHML